uniref:Mannosyl-glycoprotein endo-beta-N-acetylglucosamidase-like domain-containing protein n=2 Tax=cellular organisms TaxID=131567 RepID=A0A914YZP1_9BILA
MTTEYQNGVARKMTQTFRAYDSYAESFADYARLIGNNKRYESVKQAASPQEAAQRIQEAGYATDPSYAKKLISIMAYFDGGKS